MSGFIDLDGFDAGAREILTASFSTLKPGAGALVALGATGDVVAQVVIPEKSVVERAYVVSGNGGATPGTVDFSTEDVDTATGGPHGTNFTVRHNEVAVPASGVVTELTVPTLSATTAQSPADGRIGIAIPTGGRVRLVVGATAPTNGTFGTFVVVINKRRALSPFVAAGVAML